MKSNSIDKNAVGVALNNLFSKYGMGDGDWLYATQVQDMFEKFLWQKFQNTEYEFERLSSVHNKRVWKIKVAGEWYLTESLIWLSEDEDWTLMVPEGGDAIGPKIPEEYVPCPDDLKKVILEFLPIADYLCYRAPGTESDHSEPMNSSTGSVKEL